MERQSVSRETKEYKKEQRTSKEALSTSNSNRKDSLASRQLVLVKRISVCPGEWAVVVKTAQQCVQAHTAFQSPSESHAVFSCRRKWRSQSKRKDFFFLIPDGRTKKECAKEKVKYVLYNWEVLVSVQSNSYTQFPESFHSVFGKNNNSLSWYLEFVFHEEKASVKYRRVP